MAKIFSMSRYSKGQAVHWIFYNIICWLYDKLSTEIMNNVILSGFISEMHHARFGFKLNY
jgi:hypothetical protein